MAKLRHLAIRCDDIDSTARFFQDVFGLDLVQRRPSGATDLSDGDVNITLLPVRPNGAPREQRAGLDHIGFGVEDDAAAMQQLVDYGATPVTDVVAQSAYYEAKFRWNEVIVDVGHWRGARPVGPEPAAAAAE